MKEWCQLASSVEIITSVTETRKQNGECNRIIIKIPCKWQLGRLGSTCWAMLCRHGFEKLWPSFAALRKPKKQHHIMASALIVVLLVCSMSSTIHLTVVICLVCELLLTYLQAVIPLVEGVLSDVKSKETCTGSPLEI